MYFKLTSYEAYPLNYKYRTNYYIKQTYYDNINN